MLPAYCSFWNGGEHWSPDNGFYILYFFRTVFWLCALCCSYRYLYIRSEIYLIVIRLEVSGEPPTARYLYRSIPHTQFIRFANIRLTAGSSHFLWTILRSHEYKLSNVLVRGHIKGGVKCTCGPILHSLSNNILLWVTQTNQRFDRERRHTKLWKMTSGNGLFDFEVWLTTIQDAFASKFLYFGCV